MRVTVTPTISTTVVETTTQTITVPDPFDLSYLIDSDPSAIDNSALPVTPLELMHTIGIPREIDGESYRLSVSGMVANPLSLSYSDLKTYPAEDRVVLLICPRVFADNPRWTGVPLTSILAAAGIKPEAKEMVLVSDDEFEILLPLELAPQILLAYGVDGQVLTPGHGYPLRAVVEGRIGFYWLRWLVGIEVF